MPFEKCGIKYNDRFVWCIYSALIYSGIQVLSHFVPREDGRRIHLFKILLFLHIKATDHSSTIYVTLSFKKECVELLMYHAKRNYI